MRSICRAKSSLWTTIRRIGLPKSQKPTGVQVVFEPINQISRARNTGAASASGKYFIFLDADTILSVELLQLVLAKLTSGTCCGGGALVAFDQPDSLVFPLDSLRVEPTCRAVRIGGRLFHVLPAGRL